MKKHKLAGLAACIVLIASVLTACGGGAVNQSKEGAAIDTGNATAVATAYLQNLKELNFEGAGKLTKAPHGSYIHLMTDMGVSEEDAKKN